MQRMEGRSRRRMHVRSGMGISSLCLSLDGILGVKLQNSPAVEGFLMD